MPDIESFISRWSASGGSEQANSQLFLTELCDELGLPHPAPAQSANERNSYAFERKLPVQEGGRTSYRRIDLYRRGCAATVAARFSRARRSRVEEILGTLERLGLIELPLAG